MTICHICQTPIEETPVRTTAGEPAHSECLPDDTLPFTEPAIKAYLNRCIQHWRDSDEQFAEYYVDCFQSVRTSLFGETLPQYALAPDITPGDVEGVREELLEQVPGDAPEEYRSAWIDAVIAFDRRLTDRDAVAYPED